MPCKHEVSAMKPKPESGMGVEYGKHDDIS